MEEHKMIQSSSGLWLAVFSVVGFILTWVVMAISYGKSKGIAETRSKQLRKDLDDLKLKQETDMLAAKQSFKTEMTEVRKTLSTEFLKLEANFKNADGDQRFLTVPQHERICGQQKEHWEDIKRYQGIQANEMTKLKVVIGRIDEKLNLIMEKK